MLFGLEDLRVVRVSNMFASYLYKSLFSAIAQFGIDTMLYGYSTFLPTIISTLGTWTPPQTQALTIPCYILV